MIRIGQKLSLTILLLIISNTITGISNNEDLQYYLFKVLLISSLIIPLIAIKRDLPKKVLSWILLGMSIITLIDNDITNLNGYFLFLFSLSISIKSKRAYIIYSTIFISGLLYKFNLLHSAPSQIMEYVAGVLFIGFIYQHYIHPKPQSKQYIANYLSLPVKKYLVDVMLLYIQDKTWNEIAEILYPHKTGNSLRKDVKKDLANLEFQSYADFVLYLGQNGIIKQVDKNAITE